MFGLLIFLVGICKMEKHIQPSTIQLKTNTCVKLINSSVGKNMHVHPTILRKFKAPQIDTIFNDDGTPTQYYSGQWAAEYEAVRIDPSDTCMLENILLAVYVPSGATDSVFECTLFVWNDNGGSPGTVEFQVYSTITLNTGYWYWINYDVSDFSRQFYGRFWIGNKKTDTNSPYNLMDAAYTSGCNFWKLPPSNPNWQEDIYGGDYMKRAVVNYAKSDLYPYTPSGWSYPLVCSDSLDDTTATTSDTLTINDTCYIHFAFADSNANTPYNDTIWVKLYIDESKAVLDSFFIENLPNGSYGYNKNYPLYVTTPGPHTLSFKIDTKDRVNEADENNNTYSITYYWKAPLYSINIEIAGFPTSDGNKIIWRTNNENIKEWKVFILSGDRKKPLYKAPGGMKKYEYTHKDFCERATYLIEGYGYNSEVVKRKILVEGNKNSALLRTVYTGKLKIFFPEKKDIIVTTTDGSVLFHKRTANLNLQLPSGVYFVRIGKKVYKTLIVN